MTATLKTATSMDGLPRQLDENALAHAINMMPWRTDELGPKLREFAAQLWTQFCSVHATAPAPAVPQGWKLVPVEPTPEMKAAGINIEVYSEVSDSISALTWAEVDAIYRAMLAATPAAPSQPVTLTESERVRCLTKAGCIGTVKMTYDSGPYEITRTSINADRLIEAIIAALREKQGGV